MDETGAAGVARSPYERVRLGELLDQVDGLDVLHGHVVVGEVIGEEVVHLGAHVEHVRDAIGDERVVVGGVPLAAQVEAGEDGRDGDHLLAVELYDRRVDELLVGVEVGGEQALEHAADVHRIHRVERLLVRLLDLAHLLAYPHAHLLLVLGQLKALEVGRHLVLALLAPLLLLVPLVDEDGGEHRTAAAAAAAAAGRLLLFAAAVAERLRLGNERLVVGKPVVGGGTRLFIGLCLLLLLLWLWLWLCCVGQETVAASRVVESFLQVLIGRPHGLDGHGLEDVSGQLSRYELEDAVAVEAGRTVGVDGQHDAHRAARLAARLVEVDAQEQTLERLRAVATTWIGLTIDDEQVALLFAYEAGEADDEDDGVALAYQLVHGAQVSQEFALGCRRRRCWWCHFARLVDDVIVAVVVRVCGRCCCT